VDDGHVHQQRGEGADVRREEAVQRDRGGVGGEDLQVRDASVRERDEQVPEPDLAERVPQVREPAADVEAQKIEDGERERDPPRARRAP
jgi:hypothetical protein